MFCESFHRTFYCKINTLHLTIFNFIIDKKNSLFLSFSYFEAYNGILFLEKYTFVYNYYYKNQMFSLINMPMNKLVEFSPLHE